MTNGVAPSSNGFRTLKYYNWTPHHCKFVSSLFKTDKLLFNNVVWVCISFSKGLLVQHLQVSTKCVIVLYVYCVAVLLEMYLMHDKPFSYHFLCVTS